MDHKHLQNFLVLAETLHFGRASERCFVSAPTLSRQIKQLEEEVGGALFYRDNRSVKLTAMGKAFVGYAKSTLSNWQHFKNECLDESAPLTGKLHLFCSVTATYSFVYELVSKFRAKHTEVELHLTTGDPAQSITRVQEDKTDIAVAVKPATLAENLSFQRLGRSPLRLIAPKVSCPVQQRLEEGAPVNELAFIVSEQGVLKTRFEAWAKKRQFVPTVYAYVAGHEALVSLVSLGFGLAVVPEVVLEQSPFKDKVSILPVEDLGHIDIGLVAQKRRVNESIVAAFWSCSEEIFGS